MPIPTPNDDESKDDFISRCMSSEDVKSEFGSGSDQAVAVCNQKWDDHVEKSDDNGGIMNWLSIFTSNDDNEDVEKAHRVDMDRMSNEEAKAAFGNISAAVDTLVTRGRKAMIEMRANDVDVPDNMLSKIIRTFSGGKLASIDDDQEEEDPITLPDGVEKSDTVPPSGPHRARVAFVGAYPSQLDAIREKHFSGPVGKTLRESYVEKLGVSMEDTLRFNVIPVYEPEFTKSGNPDEEEIEKWSEYVDSVLDEYEPQTVVALGKTARDVLGDRADEWVPHPRAVQTYGESDELGRKLGRMLDKVQKTEEPVRNDGGMPVEAIAKNEEKQVVYGIVLRNRQEDADGNWTTEGEIEDAMHHYMKNHVHKTDHEHYQDIEDDVYVVESWTAKTGFTLGDKEVRKGDWVVGVKIEDPARWKMVKSGKYRGFSFAGSASIDPSKRLDD